jgi:hypothetical protein
VPSTQGTRWRALEQDLQKIAGVRAARVVGNGDTPAEIHVVSNSSRPPKQIVRDIQSLAASCFDISIDHKIVSVAQLEEQLEEQDVTLESVQRERGRRPHLQRLAMITEGHGGSVNVTLRWSQGETTEGSGTIGWSREARARGAAAALIRALEPVLGSNQAMVEVGDLVIQRIGSDEWVLVRAVFRQGSVGTEVTGSARIEDDAASASVRALLQAVNRLIA